MSEGSKIVKVGIAGVRGYKGTETARLIARHPRFRVAMVSSDVMAGNRLADIDPNLVRDGRAHAVGYTDTILAAQDYGVELMFLATKPTQCARLAPGLLKAGIRVLDLSGAHCIQDSDAHFEAYGFSHDDVQTVPDGAETAVYSLPEATPAAILREATLVANPTSYATAVLLALRPLAAAGLIKPGTVVVDAKSGASAAGRKARISLLYSEMAQNAYPSKLNRHAHTPEIVEELARVAGPGFRLTLATHLIPINRGMLATCYLRVNEIPDAHDAAAKVRAVLREAYAGSAFVRVKDQAEQVDLRQVVGTNRCVIGATGDPYGERVIVVVALDNLLKGTAGQAVQNANLMFGFDEAEGLGLSTGGLP